MQDNIISVENLKMHFPVTKGSISREKKFVKAVDGVSFEIERGKTFGLVGESGCGKTTVGKSILCIHKPTGGKIIYNGLDLTKASQTELRKVRREIQMIFQDPYGSLNPRQTAYTILKDAIKADRQRHTKAEIKERVNSLLNIVELPNEMGQRYPHEMSGGQRQRLGIARALACDPKLIVCDEPISALDVSIQAQIINLLRRIQQQSGVTFLFIAHDLAVVQNISSKVAVMYLGKIVEITEASEIYSNPLHPYTKALLSAIPSTDYDEEKKRERILLRGEVPSPINVPDGCLFHTRCQYATQKCAEVMPELRQLGAHHYVACHMINTVDGSDA